MRDDANLVDGGDERSRAAVADRRFRAVKLDDDIVDAEAADGGKHMFGGADQRTGSIAQHGLEFGGGDGAHIGADFTLITALDAGANEDDAGVRIGGVQGQRDGKTGMDANAANGDLIAKCGLPTSLHTYFCPL